MIGLKGWGINKCVADGTAVVEASICETEREEKDAESRLFWVKQLHSKKKNKTREIALPVKMLV